MALLAKLNPFGRWLALALVAWAASLPFAIRAEDFKPPEEVFHYAARIEGERLIVTWRIEPKHYLYRHRLGFQTNTPGVQLGPPQWPKGEPHEDEFFGTQEIYRGKADFPMPITFQGERPKSIALALKWQGCADEGLCYPPTTWTTTVPVPAQAAAGSGLRSLFGGTAASQDEFLPPDEAFALTTKAERPDQIMLEWQIAPEYYLYKERLKVSTGTSGVQLGAPRLPEGKPKEDEFFGQAEVYYDELRALVPISRPAGGPLPVELQVTYQGCAEAGLCYNPITKTVQLELPPTTSAASAGAGEFVAEQDRLADIVRSGNVLAVLGTFFLIGLGLSFTPCVLPMIPILSGIIVGQGNDLKRSRSFALAFTYVQGMALTYAAAGAIFVLAFRQAPQAFFQQPWMIVTFALLFVALAFAMFGAYNLQLPSRWQTRLNDISNHQKSGTFVGTFVMGALSALVVTACVAPAVIAALSVISQTGQVARGAGALYATGLGMGVPLLAIGASAGTLLPKVGPWMETVKRLFGVLFLFVATYLLSSLLPGPLTLLLYAILAITAGFWIFSLQRRDGSPAPAPLRGAGLIAMVYGILLLTGALSGSRDPLQPLDRLTARASGSGATGPTAAEHLPFRLIKTTDDLDRELVAANAAGRPVMLDFYADWCVACKEMEKYTFSAPGVQDALQGAVLLQADVTANDAADQALMRRFDIFGPPTIAFFGTDGTERRNYRVVGYMPAEQFTEHVQQAVGQSPGA